MKSNVRFIETLTYRKRSEAGMSGTARDILIRYLDSELRAACGYPNVKQQSIKYPNPVSGSRVHSWLYSK